MAKKAAKAAKSATRATKAPDGPSDQAPPEPKTRKEAEALIRSRRMTCQGPRHEASMAQWQKLMAAGKAEEAKAVRTRGVPNGDGTLVPCGYDFNETILAEPFDGAEHTSTCPKCGTETSWRSPVFPGVKG